MKADRRRALAALLRSRSVPSQAQLLTMLREQGFEATQATVSRDLEGLGAVKVRGPDGQLVYALPEAEEAVTDEEAVRSVLRLTLVDAIPSGNLIVLRTPPAHAHVLADTLDRAGLPGLLGTIAGEDTVLAICDERTTGRAVARRLRALAEPAGNVTPLRGEAGAASGRLAPSGQTRARTRAGTAGTLAAGGRGASR